MNTAQRKQLSRLILPCLILLVMVVLIIMAKARDAKKLSAALEGNTTAATTTTTTEGEGEATTEETSAPAAAVKPGTAEESGDALPADEIEGAVTIFDGQVAVSFDTMNEEASTITVRIDNLTDTDLQTQGFPKTIIDGAEVLLNPLGKNQKLNYTTIPAGQYILISYKVDKKCFSATTLELTTGTIKVMSDDGLGATDIYDLIIK